MTDVNGRSLSFFVTAGQVSDYTGAAALLDVLPPVVPRSKRESAGLIFVLRPRHKRVGLDNLPKAKCMLTDRGYDADCFQDALEQKEH